MRIITSCGFVAYTEIHGETRYLLIKSVNGDVGFPKGHVEAGESEIKTAMRELREEANVEVEPTSGFRREIEYAMPGMADTVKRSVYFLGRCIDPTALAPDASEVVDAYFVSFSEALRLLTFEDTRCVLNDARSFLYNKIQKT